MTVANTMKIAKLCVAIETKCRQKCWPNLIGEKQRDKNETILWHIHIIYIYTTISVCVRANQVQKETIIIIIINWPVAHLISFVYSLSALLCLA